MSAATNAHPESAMDNLAQGSIPQELQKAIGSASAAVELSRSRELRLLRSKCTALGFRVERLIPILRKLQESPDVLAEDPRATFVFQHLNRDLDEARVLLNKCFKLSPLQRLGFKKASLAADLDLCCSALRQCHTECVILLGGGSLPNSDTGASYHRARLSFIAAGNGIETSNGVEYESASSSVDRFRPGLPTYPKSPSAPGGLSEPMLMRGTTEHSDMITNTSTPGRVSETAEEQSGQRQRSDISSNMGARVLVQLLHTGNATEKLDAVVALTEIAATDNGKLQISAAGAVPLLTSMLGWQSESARLAAARVLVELAEVSENKEIISKSGCIAAFTSMLSFGTPEMRAVAARAVRILALNADHRVSISAAEAIPSLVALLQSDSTDSRTKRDVAEAIGQLAANNAPNQKAIADAGAISALMGMLEENYSFADREKAVTALGMIAVNNDENKLNFAGQGGVPLILDLLRQEEHLGLKTVAGWVLYVLASNKVCAKYIAASDGLEIVRTIANTGSRESQHWAMFALSHLEPSSNHSLSRRQPLMAPKQQDLLR